MNNVFPTKIRWLLPKNEVTSLKSIFGSEKIRKVKKDLDFLDENGFSYGVKILDETDLTQFYNKLYLSEIGKKHNSKVFDLNERVGTQLKEGNTIYYAYIRKETEILGGAIIYYDNEMLTLGYKSSLINKSLKTGFGNLLDYLFFQFGINDNLLDYKFFSFGKDRNGYGEFGADISLANHKLKYGFFPYSTKEDSFGDFVINDINDTTIFFYSKNNSFLLKDAIIYEKDDLGKIDLKLLEKRGINYTIIQL